jgi:hypothetical protein
MLICMFYNRRGYIGNVNSAVPYLSNNRRKSHMYFWYTIDYEKQEEWHNVIERRDMEIKRD